MIHESEIMDHALGSAIENEAKDAATDTEKDQAQTEAVKVLTGN